MRELVSIILMGVALSMDTFSFSLGVGTFSTSNKKALQLSIIVGCMHFLMPFLGMIVGDKLIDLLNINSDFLLGIILLFIAVQMIIDIIKHEEEKFNLTIIGMFLFAFGVSLDSFSVGLGLQAITDNSLLAMSVFAILSAMFTFLGVMVGRLATRFLGVYANILGAIILAILGLVHLI